MGVLVLRYLHIIFGFHLPVLGLWFLSVGDDCRIQGLFDYRQKRDFN